MINLRHEDNLRKEAKRWLKALRANDPDARARLTRAYPNAPAPPVLRDVQHALAREHGYDNWIALKRALEQPAPTPRRRHRRRRSRATDTSGSRRTTCSPSTRRMPRRSQRLNAHYSRAFTFDDLCAEIWRRVYAFRQRSSRVPKNFLQPDEAQMLVAQDAGFGSWDALIDVARHRRVADPAVRDRHAAQCASRPRRLLTDREWDQLIARDEGAPHRRRSRQRPDDRRARWRASPNSITSSRSVIGGSRRTHRRRPAAAGAHAATGVAEPERVSRRQADRSRARGAATPAEPPRLRDDVAEGHHRCRRRQPALLRSARARQSDGIADRRWRHRGAAGQAEAVVVQQRAGWSPTPGFVCCTTFRRLKTWQGDEARTSPR